MKKLAFLLIFIGLISVMIGGVWANVCGCDSCESCINRLNDSNCTIVKLTKNITSYGTCIDNPSGFNNKIFDCQFYTIMCYGEGDGIYLEGKQSNVIQNCTIYNCEDGIKLSRGRNNTLRNNEIKLNSRRGISLFNSIENLLENNLIKNNKEQGIFISSSSLLNILNNLITSNGYKGIHLENSDNVKIEKCIIYSNEDDGIFIKGANSRTNYIDKTEIYFNKGNGILVDDYGNKNNYAEVIVTQSYIHHNSKNGIRLFGGREMGLVLKDSVIEYNQGSGVYLDHQYGATEAPRGFIYNSTICNNGKQDLQIDTTNNLHKNCSGSYATKVDKECPGVSKPCPSFPTSGCVWRGGCSRYVPGRGSNFELPYINFCPAIADECKNKSEDFTFCRRSDLTKVFSCSGCGGWHVKENCSAGKICKLTTNGARCVEVENSCLANYSNWVVYNNTSQNCTLLEHFFKGCVADTDGDGVYDKVCCPVVWRSQTGEKIIQWFEPAGIRYRIGCREVR